MHFLTLFVDWLLAASARASLLTAAVFGLSPPAAQLIKLHQILAHLFRPKNNASQNKTQNAYPEVLRGLSECFA
jgi:hypothetical protein